MTYQEIKAKALEELAVENALILENVNSVKLAIADYDVTLLKEEIEIDENCYNQHWLFTEHGECKKYTFFIGRANFKLYWKHNPEDERHSRVFDCFESLLKFYIKSLTCI